MSLYQITTEVQAILEAMLDGGVDSPEAMEALDQHLQGLDAALDDKAEDYAGLIQELTMRANARAEEAKRIRTLAATDEALASRLKLRLKEAMETTGKTKIETTRFKLSVAKNGGVPALEIDEACVNNLPEQFTTTTIVPNRRAIREALEQGTTIPGCTIRPPGTSLRIR